MGYLLWPYEEDGRLSFLYSIRGISVEGVDDEERGSRSGRRSGRSALNWDWLLPQ